MSERRVSQSGLPYLSTILKSKATVITKAFLWSIARSSGHHDTNLKVGRYVLRRGEEVETEQPRSELTLDEEEFGALLKFLRANLEPFQMGTQQWIALDENFRRDQAEQLKALFASPDKRRLLDFVEQYEVFPEDLIRGLEHRQRVRAVAELEAMLNQDLVEAK